jgi:TonB family protein
VTTGVALALSAGIGGYFLLSGKQKSGPVDIPVVAALPSVKPSLKQSEKLITSKPANRISTSSPAPTATPVRLPEPVKSNRSLPSQPPSASATKATPTVIEQPSRQGYKYVNDGQRAFWRKESQDNSAFQQNESIPYHLVDTRPVLLYKEKAIYTEAARMNRIHGTVVLSMIITTEGNVSSIGVVRGLPFGLTQSAIEAARAMRWRPATKNGKPVNYRLNAVEFTFNIY